MSRLLCMMGGMMVDIQISTAKPSSGCQVRLTQKQVLTPVHIFQDHCRVSLFPLSRVYFTCKAWNPLPGGRWWPSGGLVKTFWVRKAWAPHRICEWEKSGDLLHLALPHAGVKSRCSTLIKGSSTHSWFKFMINATIVTIYVYTTFKACKSI